MTKPQSLADFNCVVTGARGATGSAIKDYLLEQGATVIGTRRGLPGPLEAVGEHEWSVQVNMSDRSAVENAVAQILSTVSPVQAWINVAGGFRTGISVADLQHSHLHEMMQMNFFTALNGCAAIVRHFQSQSFGRLINFGSAAVDTGMAYSLPYVMSKAAVTELTLTLAQELRGDVTCNIIIPSVIDTPANREAMPDADFSTWTSPQKIAETVGTILLGSMNGEKLYV
ncbi:MAG: SDR family NAD(P)-dependent oxidoreductase [Candidatus Neomarinimicrobiota bacterium]|nr:MAG: SDR family NAD(P)-dependent oxidoreductase [Candidatus Neomarinimicrobiota bacterium]